MRVLITTDVVGGVWQFTNELAGGLLSEGFSVALVSLGGSPSPEQERQCACLSSEYGLRFLYESSTAPLEWMQENDLAYSDAAPLILRIAKAFRADLLHSNQFCFGALPIDIPKVVTAHSDVLSWADACRGEPLEDSRWLRQYRRLVEQGLNGSSAVIAPTQWMMGALKGNFSFQASSAVIPNGRKVPGRFSGSRKLRAITAGRLWDKAKDVGILAEVSSPFPLYVAGDALHESSCVPSGMANVTLLGRLREDELLQFFAESAVYICTSRYEPFGLAPLEAALCGCAVLARDIPSLREVWKNGARYFTDAGPLSELLNELGEDAEVLKAAQFHSWNRAQLFTATNMVESYKTEFVRLMKEAEASVNAA